MIRCPCCESPLAVRPEADGRTTLTCPRCSGAAGPAAVLSTGREVRRTPAGTYEVQPPGDNCWLAFGSLAEAVAAGEGEPC